MPLLFHADAVVVHDRDDGDHEDAGEGIAAGVPDPDNAGGQYQLWSFQ